MENTNTENINELNKTTHISKKKWKNIIMDNIKSITFFTLLFVIWFSLTYWQTPTEWHSAPHIPKIQWEQVSGYISNTVVTTGLFFIIVLIVSILWNRALKRHKKSRLKQFFLSFIGYFDKYLIESFWSKTFARNYFALVVWIFSIIFFWNLLWLVIDWLWASISPEIVLHYMRPMHSDLNTTAVLWAITVVMFLWIGIKTHWFTSTAKSYCFNFTWDNIMSRIINVFVWWLHMIWLPSTLASLSLRLFWNIFAWIVLIWVISFLWKMMSEKLLEAWLLLSIPFWFFEIFVAFVQAVVFAWLMIAYFKQAGEEHH